MEDFVVKEEPLPEVKAEVEPTSIPIHWPHKYFGYDACDSKPSVSTIYSIPPQSSVRFSLPSALNPISCPGILSNTFYYKIELNISLLYKIVRGHILPLYFSGTTGPITLKICSYYLTFNRIYARFRT